MKRLLWSLVVVPVFMVLSAPSVDAANLVFKRAFRPVIGGVTKSFDSIAMDHNTGNIYVKEIGANTAVTGANPIIIHKFDHYGNFISTSTLSSSALGSNGEEFDLDVVAPRNGVGPGSTVNVGGTAVGEGKLLLTSGEGTEKVFVLSDAHTNTSGEITYTGTSVTLSGTGRTGGSMNYNTDVFYTQSNIGLSVGTDPIRGNDLSTGALTGSSVSPNLASPLVNGVVYNVGFEGDVAVHQQTGDLYVVSSYVNNHVVRVLHSNGTFREDIDLDAILAGQVDINGNGISGGIADGLSGIAVEPYGWDGEVNFYFGQYTTDEDIWLVTKNGWVIHFETQLPPPPPVPEPGTLGLLGLGSLALVFYRRRQSKQA